PAERRPATGRPRRSPPAAPPDHPPQRPNRALSARMSGYAWRYAWQGRGSMAAHQDDDRARQLEALRRHMVHPDPRWQPPTGVGLCGDQATAGAAGPRRRRPSRSWLTVTVLTVGVA